MRNLFLILVIVALSSCGGSISDEQRKQMQEARKEQSIQKVTDAQITEAAFEKGREVVKGLTEKTTPTQLESLSVDQEVKIRWLLPGSANALEVEKQLIDAYINSVIMGEEQIDNVQKIGTDSLLYTKALVITRPDSSIEVRGTWNVWLSKKKLILGMNKE
jgi:hypothetical protein